MSTTTKPFRHKDSSTTTPDNGPYLPLTNSASDRSWSSCEGAARTFGQAELRPPCSNRLITEVGPETLVRKADHPAGHASGGRTTAGFTNRPSCSPSATASPLPQHLMINRLARSSMVAGNLSSEQAVKVRRSRPRPRPLRTCSRPWFRRRRQAAGTTRRRPASTWTPRRPASIQACGSSIRLTEVGGTVTSARLQHRCNGRSCVPCRRSVPQTAHKQWHEAVSHGHLGSSAVHCNWGR